MENETLDLEKEHQFHTEYTEHCSTCWSEARLINAHKTVNQELHEYNTNALRGGLFGNSSPWDINPLER